MLGLTGSHNLRQVKRINSRRGQVKFRFQQTYKGIPVLNSGYLISVAEAGEINYISGDFYKDINLNTDPKLNAGQVISSIETDLRGTALDYWKEPELSIYPQLSEDKAEAFALVWHVRVRVEGQPEAWRYYIDAKNGSIIEKKSLVDDVHSVHHGFVESEINAETEAARMRRVNGSGKVYVVSPNYGGTVSRTLHRLDDVSPRRLEGDNVSVDYYNQTNATSSTGTFNYSSTNSHFDEVMAYYHSDEFEAWLIGKGLGTSQVDEVLVTTRHPSIYAGAIAAAREVYFGDSASGLNNPTREAAVITHEYMHVVSETYNDLQDLGEPDAMDEAYSDYFGIAYRDDFGGVHSSVMGEYIDQSGGKNYTRDLNNSWTMDDYNDIDLEPNEETQQHDRSVIFSGALWDFRSDPNVNADIADELVLESLGNLDANTNFLDGMYALIAAAQSSGYSSYVDDIEDAFIGKEIYNPAPSTPTNVTVTNPTSIGNPNIDWDDNPETDIDYYEVWRQKKRLSDGYIYQAVHIASPTSSSYTDTYVFMDGMQNDHDWRYAVKAVNTSSYESGLSSYSQWVNGNFPHKERPELTDSTPEEFALQQNYPNPFNPTTQITYAIPEAAEVSIKVYNIMGQQVATLVNTNISAGFHEINFDASALSSGMYIARMEAVGSSGKTFNRELKMQLIK